ncbi:helix-turn-helix domain-containing protein [Hymenobacter sp. BT635]|uniref:Helix-turn-helix domain-containing protein n=1 Tax=Hymenobacter nitidus TaxID=2880929 RepID=A0ABS8AHQ0_9BACT|nr:helix-turn-helix domain-containing protein [Hymenobacter nitidus]MCB2379965.1 helix-turn-helix domain-containing protein [Hymenobacter nitidus]
MDWIPAKLRTIRQEFKMTQLELAQASGLSQRDISQLENGRKEGLPKEFIQFLHSRGVDLNWLFTDPEQGVADLVGFSGAPRKYLAEENQPQPALVQEDRPSGYGARKQAVAPIPAAAGAATLSMVSSEAQSHYPARYLDPAFYRSLPVFTLALPEVQQGVFRCFQLASAEMLPAFAPQDWVIARADNLAAPLENGAVYVVVTNAQVLVRRVFAHPEQRGKLVLKADAAGSADAVVPLADVVELWSVRGRLSFQVPTSGVAEQKTTSLEANLQDLLARVQRLEAGK